jgi:hypothetical protein
VSRFRITVALEEFHHMSRESKGERWVLTVRPDREVSERVKQLAAETGASSVSQYVADLLALHVGMPERLRELNQEVLPLRTTA